MFYANPQSYDQVTGSQATNWFAARLEQEYLCKVSFDGLLMAVSDLYFTLGMQGQKFPLNFKHMVLQKLPVGILPIRSIDRRQNFG